MQTSIMKTRELQSIPRFKVMEWLSKVRQEEYEIYSKDPVAYFKGMKESGDEFEVWLSREKQYSQEVDR